MATVRKLFLHDNVFGGVDSTLPPHLIGTDKWCTQHNMRNTPDLVQIPRKAAYSTVGTEEIRWMGVIPGRSPGYGKVVMLTPSTLYDLAGSIITTSLNSNIEYRRWATSIYAGQLYYTNELNPLRVTNGGTDAAVSTTTGGRYLAFWYDHAVLGYPVESGVAYPNRVQISGIYDFDAWTPTPTNEADFYDFVEWQQSDFPFVGITGLAKLGKLMVVYTPTAIIPLAYVGRPKVIQVLDEMIQSRTGNTYPWTLVALNSVHFFYDAEDALFLAYSGTGPAEPIGEPVRQFMKDNLNPSITLASKMYGYVDPDYREIWWPFVSTESSGEFDKAVVFNYKYKKWYTASVENVHSFCKSVGSSLTIGQLTGTIALLDVTYPGSTVGTLGLSSSDTPRLFGSATGALLREETSSDAFADLVTADEPVLESADFHYGDLRTSKENDAMVINAAWDADATVDQSITVQAKGRDYLAREVDWTDVTTDCGDWLPTLPDGELNYTVRNGRVFRYRFTGVNMRGLKFSAFSDRVRVDLPEK